jgi:hypothetical protein
MCTFMCAHEKKKKFNGGIILNAQQQAREAADESFCSQMKYATLCMDDFVVPQEAALFAFCWSELPQ